MKTEDSLDKLVQEFIDATCEYSPTTATDLGIHDKDNQLDDPREVAVQQFAAAVESILVAAERTPQDPQTRDREHPVDSAHREAFTGMCRSTLIDLNEIRHWQKNPAAHVQTLISSVFTLMARPFAPASERAASIQARLGRWGAYLAAACSETREVPGVFADTAKEMGNGARHLLVDALPAWSQAEAPEATAELAAAAEDALRALNEHLHWIETHWRDGPASFAVGADTFERKLSAEHCLEMSADELAKAGSDLLAHTQHEITELAAQMSYPNWREALDDIRRDAPDADLLSAYRMEVDKAREFTQRGRLASVPPAQLDVVWTPPAFRATVPYAAYMPAGPFEADHRGTYWVTPVPDGAESSQQSGQIAGHNRAQVAITTLHEAYPGHHLQLSIANGLESKLGRLLQCPLLVEGWAFYCEELAWEEGYFDDRFRLYQLKDQLWRAARVVCDAKLHTGQMTLEQAVSALMECGLDKDGARSEVRRYSMTPTYQMSYAIGKREIVALRAEMRRQRASAFDLGAFHDELLSYGSIPVPLIARSMIG